MVPSAASLPGPVREVDDPRHRSARDVQVQAYELYAHVIVAEHRGLSDEKLATIVAGVSAAVDLEQALAARGGGL